MIVYGSFIFFTPFFIRSIQLIDCMFFMAGGRFGNLTNYLKVLVIIQFDSEAGNFDYYSLKFE